MNDVVDLKRKKLSALISIGIAAAAIVVLAPAIMLLVKGIVGIGIAGIVALAIVNGAPVLSMKFANWKIKAIVAEAKANPIETMVSVANDRADKLVKALQCISDLSASIKNFSDKVVMFKKQWPDEAATFDEGLNNAKSVLDQWRQKYRTAKDALDEYNLEIKKCEAVNEMAKDLAALNKMAQMDSDQLMEEMKSRTAIDEVSRRMNSAMATLETSLLEEVKFTIPAVSRGQVSALSDDTPSTGRELNMQMGLKQRV